LQNTSTKNPEFSKECWNSVEFFSAGILRDEKQRLEALGLYPVTRAAVETAS
jgi:hypothetical protein